MKRLGAMLKQALPYAAAWVAAVGLATHGDLRNRTAPNPEAPVPGDVHVARPSRFSGATETAPGHGLPRVEALRGEPAFVQPSLSLDASPARGSACRRLETVRDDGVPFDVSPVIRIDRDDLLPLPQRGVILAARRP